MIKSPKAVMQIIVIMDKSVSLKFDHDECDFSSDVFIITPKYNNTLMRLKEKFVILKIE